MAATTKAPKSVADPFAPATRDVPKVSLADSSQIVSIPHIPELFNPQFLSTILPAEPPKPKKAPAPQNAFMTALRDDVGNRALTTNMAEGYASTLDPTLDFFSVPAGASGLHDLLDKSWESDALLTLRLIFNLRSIHDGKSEKDSFYRAFGWLYRNHPRTAIANLSQLVDPVIPRAVKKPKKAASEDEEWTDVADTDTMIEDEEVKKEYRMGYSHGYYKDLLNILQLAAVDQLETPDGTFPALYSERPHWTKPDTDPAHRRPKDGVTTKPKSSRWDKSAPRVTKRQKRAARTSLPEAHAQKKAREAKVAHEKLTNKLSNSPKFRALYVAVARIFALKLAEEVQLLERVTTNKDLSDEEITELTFKIGLVSKWAPTLGGAHDRTTNIATAIAQVLHASGAMTALPVPFDPSISLSAPNLEKIRGFYRRWIISPLRRFAQIPETRMSAGEWSKINYSRVPAACMKNSKPQFYTHDAERFQKFLLDVTSGKKNIAGATLLPHELLSEILGTENAEEDPEAKMTQQVVEAQWKSLVERMREAGALDNALALCDVSGSMGSLSYHGKMRRVSPILPAVALSILVSQLAREPFANTFVTFSATPELVSLDPTKGLLNIAGQMEGSAWGMNTDFEAVFLKLILPLAVRHKIKKEDMIKRLFVFSDMQFDAANSDQDSWDAPAERKVADSWTTTHDRITAAYTEAGYDVPQIIYWNLAGEQGTKPVTATQENVAMLSGFSGNMLKLFMETSDEELAAKLEEMSVQAEAKEKEKAEKPKMDPVVVMRKAVEKPSFAGLQVLD